MIVVTGTDTDVGKTVFAAALTNAMNAYYWKPIQAGLDDGGDARLVERLGVPAARILPNAYALNTPCSPHRAAEIDGIEIDPYTLQPPTVEGSLIVEGAGGALVPVTRSRVFADLFAQWQAPVVVVARTTLGTINHSLLTIEALRARAVPIMGVAFVGDAVPDSETTICDMGGVRRLGRLPMLDPLDRDTLAAAFAEHFSTADFE
jgi:dethiobiotin synthetase